MRSHDLLPFFILQTDSTIWQIAGQGLFEGLGTLVLWGAVVVLIYIFFWLYFKVRASWRPTEGVRIIRNRYIDFDEPATVWTSSSLSSNFKLSLRVTIDSHQDKYQGAIYPDFRIHLSNRPEGFPRALVIYPWEMQGDIPDRFECHVNVMDENAPNVNEGKRVEWTAVCAAKYEPFSFKISVVYSGRGISISSRSFDKTIRKFHLSKAKLDEFHFDTERAMFVGLQATNCIAEVDRIKLRHLYPGWKYLPKP
jgi:hypothetical protein